MADGSVDEVEPPTISFSYTTGDTEFHVNERYWFWDSLDTIRWFKSHGYTLYRRTQPDSSDSCPALPFEPCSDNEELYPFAYYDAESYSQARRLCATDATGKVAYAQDSLGRHVVIKLVRAGTDELRILQFLKKQSMETLKENCVIPVLDMLPIEAQRFWFVVMPRWGPDVYLPRPRYLHEAITMMQSILKGLAFLHENAIAHHDILMRNVLVNHFSDMCLILSESDTRQEMRSNGCLLYALFDFDRSVLIPPGIKKSKFRLPYQKSWGDFNRCSDTSAGEFDYDPFAFDVGMIGVEFCDFFQHLTPKFPKLAALLDMMTTRHINRRFTAAQALKFLNESSSELPKHNLHASITILNTNISYLEYDRWCELPPDFVEKWKHYKETPVPWWTCSLRSLCRGKHSKHAVPHMRRFFYLFFTFPLTLFRWIRTLFQTMTKET